VTPLQASSSAPRCDGRREPVAVRTLIDDALLANAQLEGRCHGIETVQRHSRGRVDIHNLGLAIVAGEAGLTEGLEEAVESSTEDYDVRRPLDVESPCSLHRGTRGWVSKSGIVRKWCRGRRTWLEVRRFCLRESDVVILCVVQIVLV